MKLSRPVISEQIINLDKMDPATCGYLKGFINEQGQCMVLQERNDDNPDVVKLKMMRYQPAIKKDFYPQG